MKRNLSKIFLFTAVVCGIETNAQTITGKVTDQHTIPGISVFIAEANKGMATDDNGQFAFSNLLSNRAPLGA